jgi:hypothetical protein
MKKQDSQWLERTVQAYVKNILIVAENRNSPSISPQSRYFFHMQMHGDVT